MEIGLDENAVVLEVGSGSHPWHRADVLLDRYYKDDAGQRGGGELFVDKRPIIVAAGERLPFKDKAFDFVYCSHVIEHAEDIGAMLREISRVGREGFIECPNPLLERLLDQSQHRWYITNADGKLLICAKNGSNNVTTPADRFYFHMMSDLYIIRGYWEHFVTRLFWRGEIKFDIDQDIARVFSAQPMATDLPAIVAKNAERILRRAWLDTIKQKVRQTIGGSPIEKPLRNSWRILRRHLVGVNRPRVSHERFVNLLACPHCRSDLSSVDGSFVCNACHHTFAVSRGIPILL